MSDLSIGQGSAASGKQSPAQSSLRAKRCECQRCHAHTFLVLCTIGEAKCPVCDSHHLAPVDDD
jgi:hypothetical protein